MVRPNIVAGLNAAAVSVGVSMSSLPLIIPFFGAYPLDSLVEDIIVFAGVAFVLGAVFNRLVEGLLLPRANLALKFLAMGLCAAFFLAINWRPDSAAALYCLQGGALFGWRFLSGLLYKKFVSHTNLPPEQGRM